MRRSLAHADITRDEVGLLERDVELGVIGELEREHFLFAVGRRRNSGQTGKTRDAVFEMNDEIVLVQLAEIDLGTVTFGVVKPPARVRRETVPGHAFGPDTKWQREFEHSFPFRETPDQMKAIIDAKIDMEQPRSMDRLICGDVGFGKTEVAIRAAFKAVMDGRQVVVLAPTTVLAQQHFEVFRQRMLDYPVRIEMLSRFRSQGEQRKILELLRQGGVDIVIGTHRLISGDVIFKDLGLVVIDEEQRFGVLHKEKFKELFKLVDVLTLSATPIPRTLYLSLVGAKDMSTIETPPLNRLPVETIVCGYDERIIRDAIHRELERQGQVIFCTTASKQASGCGKKLSALCRTRGSKLATGKWMPMSWRR